MEPVSNGDWFKSFRPFLGPQIRPNLSPLLSRLHLRPRSLCCWLSSLCFLKHFVFHTHVALQEIFALLHELFHVLFCVPLAVFMPIYFMSFLVFLRFSDSRIPSTTSPLFLPMFTEIRLPQLKLKWFHPVDIA